MSAVEPAGISVSFDSGHGKSADVPLLLSLPFGLK
jgi:hypothetical protein